MIGIVIQARMGSSRFPGKVLTSFHGKPMLYFQITRLQGFDLGVPIFIITSTNPLDDEIVDFCKRHEFSCIRGDEENVISRYQLAARQFNLSHIIRLTGDNPLPSKVVIERSLHSHLKIQPDLTSTREVFSDHSIRRYVSKGLSVDIINADTLLDVDHNSLSPFEQEHVIPVFFKGNYSLNIMNNLPFNDQLDFSVDTREDLARVLTYSQF